MTNTNYEAGKRNALAIIRDANIEWARRWLADRVASTSRPALELEYVAGFEAALANPPAPVAATPSRYRIRVVAS